MVCSVLICTYRVMTLGNYSCRYFHDFSKCSFFYSPSELQVMSLLKMRKYSAGKGWTFPGLIAAAHEPYMVTVLNDVITLWNRQNGTSIKAVTVEGGIVDVIVALNEFQEGQYCSFFLIIA